MFMQAWGHYGTAWSVVHQQLGVRPHLGRDRLEVVPQVPDGQSSVQGEDIRLGDGSADVLASRDGQAPHDRHRHERGAGRGRSASATRCRAASTVASVELDGTAVTDYEPRETNRGLEVRVAADPAERHTLVVTAG